MVSTPNLDMLWGHLPDDSLPDEEIPDIIQFLTGQYGEPDRHAWGSDHERLDFSTPDGHVAVGRSVQDGTVDAVYSYPEHRNPFEKVEILDGRCAELVGSIGLVGISKWQFALLPGALFRGFVQAFVMLSRNLEALLRTLCRNCRPPNCVCAPRMVGVPKVWLSYWFPVPGITRGFWFKVHMRIRFRVRCLDRDIV